ncbi:MAG TPA: trypsin-like serine protease [Thermoanaerobaculia bacterium]|jgi:hypothetical protein|nr:trypsin-like serine protease [Thermoanaerobaculia bacterium]
MKSSPLRLWLAVVVLLGLGVVPGRAIVIRDDAPVAESIALGARYPATGHFSDSVACTLIRPRWAITAAHVAEEQQPFVDYFVTFNGKRYGVEKIIIHPQRVLGAVDSQADLALLKLDRDVEGVEPIPLYTRQDEVDLLITRVGWGKTGIGSTGATGERSREPRGMTNKIEAVFQDSFITTFDAPPAGTKLEGATGPGDSGGPAYVEVGGKTYLAGVGSNSTGNPDEGPVGKYGTVNAYCRVSTHVAWINKMIAADPPSTVQWSPLVRSSKSWPTSAAGTWLKSFFGLFNGGDAAQLAEFFASHRKPKPDAAPGKPNLDKLTESFRLLIETYGAYDLYGYKTAGPYRIAALVYSPKAKQWRSLNLELDPKAPHRSKDFFSADEEAPKGVGGEAKTP